MICKDCAKAADHGAPRESHCDDEKCPCQHRPPLRRPRRYPLVYSGGLVTIELKGADL